MDDVCREVLEFKTKLGVGNNFIGRRVDQYGSINSDLEYFAYGVGQTNLSVTGDFVRGLILFLKQGEFWVVSIYPGRSGY